VVTLVADLSFLVGGIQSAIPIGSAPSDSRMITVQRMVVVAEFAKIQWIA
jgi:hypothetical protein